MDPSIPPPSSGSIDAKITPPEQRCSNFAVAGPLCQMMALGIIAQRLNRKVLFDRKTEQITNDKLANELLLGPPPRQEWEVFYKL